MWTVLVVGLYGKFPESMPAAARGRVINGEQRWMDLVAVSAMLEAFYVDPTLIDPAAPSAQLARLSPLAAAEAHKAIHSADTPAPYTMLALMRVQASMIFDYALATTRAQYAEAARLRRALGTGARGSWEPRQEAQTSVWPTPTADAAWQAHTATAAATASTVQTGANATMAEATADDDGTSASAGTPAAVTAPHDATPRSRSPPGHSVAFRWIRSVEEQGLIPPCTYGFCLRKLYHSTARALARGRAMLQGCAGIAKTCPLPGCGRIVTNVFHGRGPCRNQAQSNAITSAGNHHVHTIAEYINKGDYARWTVLINAGTRYAASGMEDATVPDDMLPGAFGHRAFPDKVDIMLVIGWPKGEPMPQDKTKMTLVPVEVTSSHDHYLHEARNRKMSKYVELTRALSGAGWTNITLCPDDPDTWYMKYANAHTETSFAPAAAESGELCGIHTVVVGHCGSHLRTNLDAFAALGITRKEDSHDLLLRLSQLAARQLRDCQSVYRRACKLAHA